MAVLEAQGVEVVEDLELKDARALLDRAGLQAPDLAAYLEYHGFAASAARGRNPETVEPTTAVIAYNGAETRFPETIAWLEARFKVTATPVTDPKAGIDILVVQGTKTPTYRAP